MMATITTLIPHYSRFVREHKSLNGDDATAADTFLYKVLPFVVECVVTSGIFFVKDFPNSPFTPLLRVSFLVTNFPFNIFFSYHFC